MNELLQNITPKKRLYLLVGGLFLLFFAAYQFSFKNTITQYTRYQHHQRLLEAAKTAPAQINQLEKQLQQFEKIIKQTTYDKQLLFTTVNNFCRNNNLKLSHFEPEERGDYGNLEIITNQLEVQGDFTNIIRLTYILEYIKEIGYVASLNFELKKDKYSKKEFLSATLYLQYIEAKII